MNKRFLALGLSATLGLALPSCGSGELDNYPWTEPRPDKTEEAVEDANPGAEDPAVMAKEVLGAMSTVVVPKEHAYQYFRANHVDVYAGYWTVTQNKFLYGGALPTTYTFPNSYLMGAITRGVFSGTINAYRHAARLGVEYRRAIAILMQDLAFQEMTDIYGPLPFDDFRNVKLVPPMTYISQQEIYTRIFAELDEANEILYRTQPTQAELNAVEGEKGGLSRGDWRYWVKFSNSLRLRMAMNIVKVAPALAQLQAEKAMNDQLGVLTDADAYDFTQDREYCSWMGNNPLWMISEGWDDLRLGASLENIMKRHRNPLIGVWFTKHGNIVDASGNSTGYMAEDESYMGVRQGIAMINKSNKTRGYGPYSRGGVGMMSMPLPWMKRTEMLFTMAEAALRGWNVPGGASAEDFYRRGVILSFTENGLSREAAEEYLAQTTIDEVDYVDPYNMVNNIAGRVKVAVAWSDDDTNEVKLEKIITQRYMAVFPCSATTWTTFRRTGYPRLFPVYINNWPGVDGELQLRRIPFVQDVNNAQELATLPALLGGPNEGGTRLWWDVSTEIVTNEPGDDQAKSFKREPKNF